MEAEELFCSVCNLTVVQEDEICPHCGSDLVEFEDQTPSERKYSALMRIRESLKIIIAVLGTTMLVGLLYGIFLKDMDIIMYTIIPLIDLGMLLIFFELIKVIVDIEQNTRTQTRLLNKLLKK
jgi:hypothetical protein